MSTLLLSLILAPSLSNAANMAMNDKMIVAAYNSRQEFAVQFASATTACISSFSNTTYVQAVALSRASNRTSFAYIASDLNSNQSFLAVMGVSENCTFGSPDTLALNSTSSKLFALLVHPTENLIFAFAKNLTVIWQPDTRRSEILPMSGNVSPMAVDNNQDYLVTVGYSTSNVPVISLMPWGSCNISTSFQRCLTPIHTLNYSADSNTTTLSVKISDSSSVVWSKGSQLMLFTIANSTFLIQTSATNTTNAILDTAWTDNESVVAMSSSQVLSYSTNLTLTSTFPNSWKGVCSTLSTSFRTIAPSTRMGLAVRDANSSIYIIRPTTPGYYPVTTTGCAAGIRFGLSGESQCASGSYHRETSARPCSLCPQGTFNDGSHPVECAPCDNTSFCSLGAVANIDGSAMDSVMQARAYPKSPDNTIFDDILLQNIFSLEFSRHCLVVSPLFWTLIVIGVTLILVIVMAASELFPGMSNIRRTIKLIFTQTDLIGEGELWVGGIVSFSIIVLVSFAYVFSALYLRQYPVETSSDSSFACNPKLRNSKFSTQMQVLGIPLTEEVQPMFDMLDKQPYTLNVDFVNTLFHCGNVSVQQTIGTVVTFISPKKCEEHGGILAVAVALPSHGISVQLILTGMLTVGGIRVGLSGPEAHDGEEYEVHELDFMQTFSIPSRVLSPTSTIQMQMIRLINATEPLNDGEPTRLSALWIPTFAYVPDQVLVTEAQFVGNSRPSTLLTLTLSEKAYYVINTQSPITKKIEVVFRSILFTIVCLEIFGLLFIITKLLFAPFFHRMMAKCHAMHGLKKVEAETAAAAASNIP